MAVTPYRQPIWPGDVGRDVKAVKRGMQVMGITGSGGLALTTRAGESYIKVLNRTLHQHGLPADGKYGPKAHAVIAPHFDLYGKMLYRTAAIRTHTPPFNPSLPAQAAAKRLLVHAAAGRYHADNPGDLHDIRAAAAGQAVWSRGGYWVHIDRRPLDLLLWLIEVHDYRLGTYALCSDHHWDGPHGHSGGLATDISSINGHSIGGSGMHGATLTLAKLIHQAPAPLRPRQLICGGSGYIMYSDIMAQCIPSPAVAVYGYGTLLGHRNHIHAGY